MGLPIRITFSLVNEATQQADATSLVSNWPVQTDQPAAFEWSASQQDKPILRPAVFGGGGVAEQQGWYSGFIYLYMLTPDMRDYLYSTKMSGNLSTAATIYAYEGLEGWGTFQGRIVLPHRDKGELYEWWSEDLDHTVRMEFYRGVKL